MYQKGWGVSDLPQWLNATLPFVFEKSEKL
jgi:hypothetical protein